MDIKFVVFVVFAIVTQNSVLLSSAAFQGFSEEAVSIFNQLTAEDETAQSESARGLKLLFNLLRNGTNPASSYQPYLDALLPIQTATDLVFYPTPRLAVRDCSDFESALNESRAELNRAFQSYIYALELAHGGNYYEHQSEIEQYQNLTEAGLLNVSKILFDLLRCCESDSSELYESLIDEVEEKVNRDFCIATAAAYSAIKDYAILSCEESMDRNVTAEALISIDKSELIAVLTIREIIEYIFSLHETRYIATYIDTIDLINELFLLRIRRKKISDNLDEIVRLIFIPILEKLLEHTHYEDIRADYQLDNLILSNETKAIAVFLFQKSNDLFLNTVLETLENSTDYVTVARIILPHVIPVIISHYYHGIALAVTDLLPLHLSLLAIGSVEEIQSLVCNYSIGQAFEVFGDDPSTAVRLSELQEIVTDSTQETNDAIFTAIKILARIVHGIEGAKRADFEEVLALRATATAAANHASHYLLGANVRRLIVSRGY